MWYYFGIYLDFKDSAIERRNLTEFARGDLGLGGKCGSFKGLQQGKNLGGGG